MSRNYGVVACEEDSSGLDPREADDDETDEDSDCSSSSSSSRSSSSSDSSRSSGSDDSGSGSDSEVEALGMGFQPTPHHPPTDTGTQLGSSRRTSMFNVGASMSLHSLRGRVTTAPMFTLSEAGASDTGKAVQSPLRPLASQPGGSVLQSPNPSMSALPYGNVDVGVVDDDHGDGSAAAAVRRAANQPSNAALKLEARSPSRHLSDVEFPPRSGPDTKASSHLMSARRGTSPAVLVRSGTWDAQRTLMASRGVAPKDSAFQALFDAVLHAPTNMMGPKPEVSISTPSPASETPTSGPAVSPRSLGGALSLSESSPVVSMSPLPPPNHPSTTDTLQALSCSRALVVVAAESGLEQLLGELCPELKATFLHDASELRAMLRRGSGGGSTRQRRRRRRSQGKGSGRARETLGREKTTPFLVVQDARLGTTQAQQLSRIRQLRQLMEANQVLLVVTDSTDPSQWLLACDAGASDTLHTGWAEVFRHRISMAASRQVMVNRMAYFQRLTSMFSLYFSAVEHAAESIEIWDMEGRVHYVNLAHSAVSGFPRWEVIGTSFTVYFASVMDMQTFASSVWYKLRKGRLRWVGQVSTRRKNGAITCQECKISRVRSVVGEATDFFVVTKRDITQQLLEQKELRLAHKQAEEASQMKSMFLSQTSHDIRNPMSAIQGYAELLLSESDKLSSSQLSSVTQITKASRTIMTLLNDLLDLAKIEAGKMSVEYNDFDMRACVEDCVDLLYQRAFRHDVLLAAFIDPRLPTWVVGDRDRISQILINLISNAVKFTHKGSVVVKVQALHQIAPTSEALPPTAAVATPKQMAEAEEVPCMVHFEVVDTGIGIPEHKISQLFKPFNQTHDTASTDYGGTGLGLVICKTLVNIMGGDIGVHSTFGVGTTFWFNLPLPMSSNVDASDDVQPDLHGHRLIGVDPEATTRGFLAQQLSFWGIPFDMVTSEKALRAKVAEEHAAGQPYDLALIDLGDPAGSLELASKLAVTMHCVVLVPVMSDTVERRANEVGVAAVIPKPTRYSQLASCMDRLFNEGKRSMRLSGDFKKVAERTERQLSEVCRFIPHILVVDDNFINQKVSCRLLNRLGCKTDVKNNGAEAVDAIAAVSYDLVFMDCQMPILDGYEAVRRVREAESTSGAHVIIVALTGNGSDGERERCLACGMDDVLTKPVSMSHFDEKLRQWTKWVPSEANGKKR